MDKHKATEILLQKITEWENKPKTDGYERFAAAIRKEFY